MLIELTAVDILDPRRSVEKVWINLNHVERVVPYKGNCNFLVLYTVLGTRYYIEEQEWDKVISLLQGGNKNGRLFQKPD